MSELQHWQRPLPERVTVLEEGQPVQDARMDRIDARLDQVAAESKQTATWSKAGYELHKPVWDLQKQFSTHDKIIARINATLSMGKALLNIAGSLVLVYLMLSGHVSEDGAQLIGKWLGLG